MFFFLFKNEKKIDFSLCFFLFFIFRKQIVLNVVLLRLHSCRQSQKSQRKKAAAAKAKKQNKNKNISTQNKRISFYLFFVVENKLFDKSILKKSNKNMFTLFKKNKEKI